MENKRLEKLIADEIEKKIELGDELMTKSVVLMKSSHGTAAIIEKQADLVEKQGLNPAELSDTPDFHEWMTYHIKTLNYNFNLISLPDVVKYLTKIIMPQKEGECPLYDDFTKWYKKWNTTFSELADKDPSRWYDGFLRSDIDVVKNKLQSYEVLMQEVSQDATLDGSLGFLGIMAKAYLTLKTELNNASEYWYTHDEDGDPTKEEFELARNIKVCEMLLDSLNSIYQRYKKLGKENET